MTWRDITSYQRGDEERVPRVLEMSLAWLKLKVHRYHGCPGWYLSAHDLGFECRALTADDLEDAKGEALALVRERAGALSKALESLPHHGGAS